MYEDDRSFENEEFKIGDQVVILNGAVRPSTCHISWVPDMDRLVMTIGCVTEVNIDDDGVWYRVRSEDGRSWAYDPAWLSPYYPFEDSMEFESEPLADFDVACW
jgi:hypothetical protein